MAYGLKAYSCDPLKPGIQHDNVVSKYLGKISLDLELRRGYQANNHFSLKEELHVEPKLSMFVCYMKVMKTFFFFFFFFF